MTQKRPLQDNEQKPSKRVRRACSLFPLNLFRLGKKKYFYVLQRIFYIYSFTFTGPFINSQETVPSTSETIVERGKCESCNSAINIDNFVQCDFCEQRACLECELLCVKCNGIFCRFCAVKTYDSRIDSSAKCFSCR